MPLHHQAYARLMGELGGRLDRAAFDAAVGPPARVTIPLFAAAAGLDPAALPDIAELHARKKLLLAEIMLSAKPETLATVELIAGAPAELRIAIVTSGNRHGAEAILRSIGLFERVELVVSGDNVAHGKPDAEPYATACALLWLAPADCLAFEEPVRAEGGRGAGKQRTVAAAGGAAARPGAMARRRGERTCDRARGRQRGVLLVRHELRARARRHQLSVRREPRAAARFHRQAARRDRARIRTIASR